MFGGIVMRRAAILSGVVLALGVLSGSSALAVTIGFSPDSQTVGPGDSLTVDIVVSDLGGEIVSAYDLDITYDASVIAATSVAFGPLLGDEALFEVFNDYDLSVPGLVDLAQLSLLSDAELLALQGGDSFALATLGFDAVGLGTSSLDYVFDAFNDIKGLNAQPLEVVAQSGAVSVIPEPGAALLFVVGVIAVGRAMKHVRRI
jgi:hypothetical protein